MLKACIFDLDGVVIDTAKYHYLAWKRLANEYGFDFDEHQNEHLKGVSRMQSLELILKWANVVLTQEEKVAAAKRKNDWYVEYVSNITPDEILPGVVEFLDNIKDAGLKIALGSASRNSLLCLERIELLPYFDVIIDGNKVTTAKPDPEVFLRAARELNVDPEDAVVFEDALVGIEAANRGGFFSVGVGDENVLNNADVVISDFKDFNLETLREALVNI
ncbi:MAG: beta-phosphoglucomutase [Bacteroidia bacterium]